MHSQMEKITRMEFYSKITFTPLKTLDQGTLTKHRQALFRSMATSSVLQTLHVFVSTISDYI